MTPVGDEREGLRLALLEVERLQASNDALLSIHDRTEQNTLKLAACRQRVGQLTQELQRRERQLEQHGKTFEVVQGNYERRITELEDRLEQIGLHVRQAKSDGRIPLHAVLDDIAVLSTSKEKPGEDPA